MDQSILTSPAPTSAGRTRSVFSWLAGIVCFGFLLTVILLIAHQIIVPPAAPRVVLVRNIPLPEGLKNKGAPDSLASATSQFFDGFDFQSIDSNTHLLFIAHTGPVPDDLDGKVVGERLLDKPLLTIGRRHGNDVWVPNQRVSRLHARIRYENKGWVIEDAESVNGIVYQGVRVERLALNNGDKVYIAPTAMLYYQAR